MANLKKYTRVQIGHILKHCSRSKDEQGNYIKFGNENINTEITNLNYNLASRHDGLSDYDFIKNRCKELKALNRKDVNIACSWVVTIPHEYYKGAQFADFDNFFNPENENPYITSFFSKTYEFLKNRYGEKNIVSSYVHLDETTPHMHFIFTPAVWDKKKGREKISAKELIDKKELIAFHPALNAYLNKTLKKELKKLNIQDVGVMIKNPCQKTKSAKDLEIENKELKLENNQLKEYLKDKTITKNNKEISTLDDFYNTYAKKSNEKEKEKDEYEIEEDFLKL